jgi:hypothetical protein
MPRSRLPASSGCTKSGPTASARSLTAHQSSGRQGEGHEPASSRYRLRRHPGSRAPSRSRSPRSRRRHDERAYRPPATPPRRLARAAAPSVSGAQRPKRPEVAKQRAGRAVPAVVAAYPAEGSPARRMVNALTSWGASQRVDEAGAGSGPHVWPATRYGSASPVDFSPWGLVPTER